MREFSDREREWISRQTAELARNVPPPDKYLSLAKAYSEGRITALRYDPESRVYKYKDVVTKEERFLPESEFQEHVAMVCEKDDGELYTRVIPPLEGQLGAAVNKSACYPDRPVGVIHTHPAGASFPSPQDLYVETDPDISVMCVGSKQVSSGSEVYPVMCFYRYPWVDKEDIARVVVDLDRRLQDFMSSGILKNTLRIDVYDSRGIRFVYIFPPPLATRYLVQKLREDPKLSSVFDIDYRVWDESDLSPEVRA